MSEWISVKERLPEGLEDVLVFAFFHERWETMIGWHRKSDDRWYIYTSHGERWVSDVTHWMPKPKSPVVVAENATASEEG